LPAKTIIARHPFFTNDYGKIRAETPFGVLSQTDKEHQKIKTPIILMEVSAKQIYQL